jgi:alkanesulfonate monooxygenase SsuD/methylene tetrahydromethanopterin reductase-like flavin-dependent oxidoreductase (luciferase family)
MSDAVQIGITLPSFRDTPEPALEVARAAERSGVDGVFAYDHLFRRSPRGERRPALEMFTLLGAVAAETREVAIGSLVARAKLRAPAVLAHGFATLARIAGRERLRVGIGAGDAESREEMETFGYEFGSVADRVRALRDSVDACRDRGFPVWVGGVHPAVREVAATHADGWNRWGGSAETFGKQAEALRVGAVHQPFSPSWGGLLVLARTDADAAEKARRLGAGEGVIVGGPARVADALRSYVERGAEWLMIGPIDAADPENARVLGEEVVPRMRGG